MDGEMGGVQLELLLEKRREQPEIEKPVTNPIDGLDKIGVNITSRRMVLSPIPTNNVLHGRNFERGRRMR